MLKKSLFSCALVMFFAAFLCTTGAEARPHWVSVAYSGFSIHKNADQTDPSQPGYYFAKIVATCTNNGSAVITGLSSRSMGFTAQAYEGANMVGTATGNIAINQASTLDPVHPGESFTITYSVPVMAVDGVSLQQFNSSYNARLRKYSLKHNFSVITQ